MYLHRPFIVLKLFAVACLGFVVSLASARAEHRVALLIGNGKYEDSRLATSAGDLRQVAKALEKHGFRSQMLVDLPGDKLKSALESFAESTPTCGTAAVYFRGRVLPGNYKGNDGTFLVGIDARQGDARAIGNAGFNLDQLLETLDTRGGSRTNLVMIDPAGDQPKFQRALPSGCLLAIANAKDLASKLGGNGDVVTAIRAASSVSKSNLAEGFAITGPGAEVVAAPDDFMEGKHAGDEWVNSRGMVFCWCPPGSYVAGSPVDEPGRYPDEEQHEVQIDHGFWISKYEMTLRENLRNHPRSTIAVHKNDPLTMINHDDAKNMTTRTFSEQERESGRLPAGWQYSLPTHQQWEYAARAGTTSRFYFGDNIEELPQHANFGDKSYFDSKGVYSNAAHRTLDDGFVKLAQVGSFKPNPWGLHDVYGNVAEWCIDYEIRGGSWASAAENCRSAYRDSFSSRNEQNFIGYRLVIQRIPPAKPKPAK